MLITTPCSISLAIRQSPYTRGHLTQNRKTSKIQGLAFIYPLWLLIIAGFSLKILYSIVYSHIKLMFCLVNLFCTFFQPALTTCYKMQMVLMIGLVNSLLQHPNNRYCPWSSSGKLENFFRFFRLVGSYLSTHRISLAGKRGLMNLVNM